jgi:mannose-1-phosphate guanylyltransferase/mannose-6-phosphate isomerase
MSRRQARPSFHVVLLAGGSGTRFWPLSRADRPKQFLALLGGRPLLVETWKRVRGLASPSRIWVVAPSDLADRVREHLPGLRRDRLIIEPSPRNTGPAVTLACATVARHAPGAIVGVFPTDHVIPDEKAFFRAVGHAAEAADRGGLVCLGIRPDRPATGFGYLLCKDPPRPHRAVRVARFVEKPDLAKAKRFLRSGRYLWNAGMFVWRVERYLEEAERAEPRMVHSVKGYLDGTPRSWNRSPKLSVDYAVMERAEDVQVVPLEAGWNDLGSWEAAARLTLQRSTESRQRLMLDSPDSAVFGSERFVAVVGLPGVTVIDTPDALLVVSREHAEDVKKVVDHLRRTGRRDLL